LDFVRDSGQTAGARNQVCFDMFGLAPKREGSPEGGPLAHLEMYISLKFVLCPGVDQPYSRCKWPVLPAIANSVKYVVTLQKERKEHGILVGPTLTQFMFFIESC